MGIWQRYKKFYKLVRFYDADFSASLFTQKTKSFREKGVFFVRQNRKLTWKLANKINPYKLRRRRRSFKAVAYLMKQRLKRYYWYINEKKFRRIFARARHSQRLRSRSATFLRFLERRVDNAVLRLGIFKMTQLKYLIQRYGVFINGKLCKRMDRLLSVGDIITFPSQFAMRQRFFTNLRQQYPFTKKERNFRSLWNKSGLCFSFKLGTLKAGNFLLEPRTFSFLFVKDIFEGKEVFYPFDFDVNKILKVYQAVK